MSAVPTSVVELEPNDEIFAGISESEFGVEQSAHLSGAFDIDFFRFKPVAPGLIELNFSADDGGATRFELTQFALDGMPVDGSTQTVQGDGTLLFYADDVADGVYIRVSAAIGESEMPFSEDGLAGAPAETAYAFTANWFAYAAPGNEQEPNDYYADPLTAGADAMMAGRVESSDDEDWFYVDIEAASTVSFAVLLGQTPAAGSKPIYAAVYG
ncbi:MAG: hypothetical protein RL458_3222, partial [Pseudomonadota bacterium]